MFVSLRAKGVALFTQGQIPLISLRKERTSGGWEPSLQQTLANSNILLFPLFIGFVSCLCTNPPAVTGSVGAVVYIPSCCLLRTFFSCILSILFVPTVQHDPPVLEGNLKSKFKRCRRPWKWVHLSSQIPPSSCMTCERNTEFITRAGETLIQVVTLFNVTTTQLMAWFFEQ